MLEFSHSLASELSGHKLEIEPIKDDVVVEPRGPAVFWNKIGGKPYFYYDDPKYIASVDQLFKDDFISVLQTTCPDPKEAPKGAWPFFEFTFQLFAKQTSEGILWKYGWG